jgi:hypothetical protein
MSEQPVGEHAEHEDEPWEILIPDHPGRTESEAFRHAKKAAHQILAAVREQPDSGLLVFLAGG